VACIRKRRGKWVADWRDGAGRRRWQSFETRKDAENFLADQVRLARQPTRPVVDPKITVAGYAERWLGIVKTSAKPRTVEIYDGALQRHILPVLGAARVAELHRTGLKEYVAAKLRDGLARGYLKTIVGVLQALLSAAQEDGIIVANPATALGRQFKLSRTVAAKQQEVKAMTREQLATFLATAERETPRLVPLFLCLARTGMRLGEGLALQWPDLDFGGRTIRVARALSAGRIETPKAGTGRTVDMSQQLAASLQRLRARRAAEALKRGWPELPPWVFCTRTGRPVHPRVIQIAYAKVLKKAGLPEHFTPHCLRHSYASRLLSDGVSPAYVQRQLGHSSIRLTVDLYGRWLPMENKAAVDRLDDGAAGETGSKTVAAAAPAPQTLGIPRRLAAQPPRSFFSESRKPPTRGPCSAPLVVRSNSSSSSRWRAVSLLGTSTTTR
jgi:integrase